MIQSKTIVLAIAHQMERLVAVPSHSHALPAPSPKAAHSIDSIAPKKTLASRKDAVSVGTQRPRRAGRRRSARPTGTRSNNAWPARRCCFLFRWARSEEHTSELQSRQYLVCRLLL